MCRSCGSRAFFSPLDNPRRIGYLLTIMATSALSVAPKVPFTPRNKRVVFKKRQRGARLWNRFYNTLLIPSDDAPKLLEELRASHPEMEFDLELENA